MRIFSGIQATGDKHLGNLIGGFRQYAATQGRGEAFFCIVDLHSITVDYDPAEFRERTFDLAAILFATGLDPERSTYVFAQSHVPAHAEAAWLLGSVTSFGQLGRMTQFKDKSDRHEFISAGLFTYPVLMAGDILLYQTDIVPIGDDQRQHLELTRDVAERFNRLFGDTFVVPEALIGESGARIMGLADPEKKMSKSDDVPGQAIGIFDKPDDIRKAIMRATTDSQREIRFDERRAGIFNLLTIFEVLSGESRAGIEARFEGKGYGDFKKALADVVLDALAPVQARYHELMTTGELDALLRRGAERAAPVANKTLRQVKHAMGFLQ